MNNKINQLNQGLILNNLIQWCILPHKYRLNSLNMKKNMKRVLNAAKVQERKKVHCQLTIWIKVFKIELIFLYYKFQVARIINLILEY